MTSRILSIAVHPDDETLGCGGTLLKHAAEGEALHWLLITAVSEPDYTAAQITRQREQVEAVRKAYRFESVHWLKFPSSRLETLPLNDLIKPIRHVIQQVRPETVFAPNPSDVHSDHRIAFQAVTAALKAFYMRGLGVRRVLACEVISETEAAPPQGVCPFLPTVFVDISATLARKLEIMALYESEIQPDPMPRGPSAIRALARYRGASVGVEYAEAFMLIRECCW